MTLKEVKAGHSAKVSSVGGSGALRQHLLDMGIIPGTDIRVIKYAPMGDPVEICLHGYDLTLKKKTTSFYYRDRYGLLYGEEGSSSHGIGIITYDGDYDGNYIDTILYNPFYYQGHIYYLDNDYNLRKYPDGSVISYDVNDYFIIYDDIIYFSSVSGDLFKAPLDDISNVEKLSDGRPSGIVVYKDWLYYLDTEDNYFLYRIPISGGEAELVEARSYNAINIIGDCLYFSCRSGGYARMLLTDEAA